MFELLWIEKLQLMQTPILDYNVMNRWSDGGCGPSLYPLTHARTHARTQALPHVSAEEMELSILASGTNGPQRIVACFGVWFKTDNSAGSTQLTVV